MSMTKARTRKRNLEVTEEQTQTQKAQDLARKCFLANKAMNRAKGQYEAARKNLYALMKSMNLKTLDIDTTNEEGNALLLQAVIGVSTKQEVDVATLQKLVPLDLFLKIVEATQKSVEDVAGTPVLQQVLVSKLGKESVKVSTRE